LQTTSCRVFTKKKTRKKINHKSNKGRGVCGHCAPLVSRTQQEKKAKEKISSSRKTDGSGLRAKGKEGEN